MRPGGTGNAYVGESCWRPVNHAKVSWTIEGVSDVGARQTNIHIRIVYKDDIGIIILLFGIQGGNLSHRRAMRFSGGPHKTRLLCGQYCNLLTSCL